MKWHIRQLRYVAGKIRNPGDMGPGITLGERDAASLVEIAQHLDAVRKAAKEVLVVRKLSGTCGVSSTRDAESAKALAKLCGLRGKAVLP